MSDKVQELIRIFEAMADLLDIQGENTHRVLAYRRAAENLLTVEEPLELLLEQSRLKEIPGIGSILAAKIEEYLKTGKLEAYERLKQQVPLDLLEVLKIPGVGPRKTALFWTSLGITNMDDLEVAAKAGRLHQLKGIGRRTEQQLLEGIQDWRRQRIA